MDDPLLEYITYFHQGSRRTPKNTMVVLFGSGNSLSNKLKVRAKLLWEHNFWKMYTHLTNEFWIKSEIYSHEF